MKQSYYYDVCALIGRVLIVALYLPSGVEKLGNSAGTIQYIAAAQVPLPALAYAASLVAEILLPIALVLGYRVRLSAILLALYTLVAALFFHLELGDQNQAIHFFKNIAIVGGLLQIVAFGGGRISVDHKLGQLKEAIRQARAAHGNS